MANYTTRTYDPGQYDFNVGGNDASGYADGTFIKVSKNVDQAALVVGSDGDNTLALSQNKSGKFSITLQQSSPTNDYYSSLANALENRTGGIVPIFVKDNNGTSLASGKQCWVVKRPDMTAAKDVENREWIFETGNLVMNVGGSNLLA